MLQVLCSNCDTRELCDMITEIIFAVQLNNYKTL